MSKQKLLQIFRITLVVVLMLGGLLSSGSSLAAPSDGSYIIVFHDKVDVDATVPSIAQAHRLQVGFVYRHALKGMSASVPAGRLTALQKDPRVAYVVEDMERSIDAQIVPTGVQRIFADVNGNINIDGVDDYRVDVDVAVIDTGVDFEHTDLNVVGGVDCSGGGPFGGSCGSGGDDDHYHGTHVAGTIAAIDNGDGVVGVAPGARIWAVKVLDNRGSGWSSWIIAGIDWVAANADTIEVANMSLGGSGFNQGEYDAIQGAVDAGVAFAVAAGNSGDDANNYSPAAFDNALTVSALADFDGEPGGLGSPTCRADQDDTLADFSNWGNAVQIAAPGVCILSTFPIEEGEYGTISGTSMASPHAAGALALLASANNPDNAADVSNLYDQVINSGNFDWMDDSGDGIQEPLLDVSNTSLFNPTLVPGSGGSGDPDTTPPNAPANLSAGGGDGFVNLNWDDNTESDLASYYVYRSETAGGSYAQIASGVTTSDYSDTNVTNGTTYYYVVTAVDTSGNESAYSNEAPATPEANATPPTGGGMYVWDIAFSQKEYGPGGSFHDLMTTVTIRVDSDDDGIAESTDNPVADASVSMELCGTECWNFGGTTDSSGQVIFTLKRAPTGGYQADVTGVTHSTLTWDSSLDADNPDTYTLQ